MRRRFRIVGIWGTLVLIVLSGLLVGSGAGSAASHPGSTPFGRGGPTVEPTPSLPGLSPTNVTVAPAFSAPSGVATLGPARSNQSMTVLVGLALSSPAGLSGLISAQYTPGTPEFRHFESPNDLAEQFGPAASTVSAARSYFEGFGLSVVPSPDRLFLTVSGSAGRVASAFGTEFVDYRAGDGRTFVSHPTPATLPSGIAWSGAFGLGNATSFVPENAGPILSQDAILGEASCVGGLGELTPCDFHQAYNMTSLISNGTTGAGERLAIVDVYSSAEDQTQLESDLATFALEEGLPTGTVEYVYPDPAPGSLNSSANVGWALEDSLDLEWARAAAPNATIDMTFSPNSGVGLYEAVDWLVAHHSADVISLSWGEPDVGRINAYNTPCSSACNASTDGSYALLSPVLEFAAAEGIGVFAASGDCGASDGTSGLSTNFPASDPYVTGVGGTVLNVDSEGDWVSEVAWGGNSSGASAPGCENQGGSGGGYAPFPRAPWQTGLPSDEEYRGVPDVALDAGSPVVVIADASMVGVLGTSIATPVWAGIAALADQYAGRALGLLTPTIYTIGAGANYTHDFHDIVLGSNGYSAGPGWDPVTGVGSPIVSSLVDDLAHPTTVPSSDLAAFVYAAPRFGRAPLTVDFAVQATGGTGSYPLEGVSFGNGNASFATGGNTSYTFETPGVYSVEAYVVDSASQESVSPPLAVVVGGGNSLTVNLTASTETPSIGASVEFSVQVSGGVAPYSFNYAFGDGTYVVNSSADTASHEYGAAGSFCPAVVVSDSGTPPDGAASARVAVGAGGASLPDCRNDTVPLSITAVPNPGVRDAPADFSQLFTISGGPSYSGSPPASLQFSSTDPYVSACECAIFRQSGTYPVVGFANDTETQEANASTTVTVAPPLAGAFTASATYGPAPLTVALHVNASGGYGADAANTLWTFGNGQRAVGDSASETYDSPGFYVALGHLSDLGAGNVSEAFLIDVGPTDAPASPGSPYLVATVTPAADVAWGESVNFSAGLRLLNGTEVPALFHWNLSSAAGAYEPSFNWTFPFMDLENALTAGLSATVRESGERLNTTLEFPSFGGGVSADGSERAVDGLEFTPVAPSLVLAAGVPWVATPSRLVGPGSLSVSWAFGDGTTEVNRAASHVFSEGLYTVNATATDSWGDATTSVFAVAVFTVPILNATLSATAGPSPLRLSFSAGASGGFGPPYWYAWSLGDGATATGPNGSYTFASPGTFIVSVTVSDGFGEITEKNWTVTVEPPFVWVGVGILGAGAAVGAAAAVAVVGSRRRRPGAGPPSPSPPREERGGPPAG